MARDGADHGTLWATTSAGRIFVTHNADASNPATVTWHRIDNADLADPVPERDLRRSVEPATPGSRTRATTR